MASTAYRLTAADPGVGWLDELAAPQARALLWGCCGSATWAGQVAAARPFRTRGRLLDYADSAIRRMEWSEVRQALAPFPRLGEGADSERSSAGSWLRREWQVFAAGGFEDEDLARAAALGAREYEQRFGYVFLVCGQGRTARQILAALATRLTNEPRMERQVVRAELAAITRVRLVTLLARPPLDPRPAQPPRPGRRAALAGRPPQRLLSAVSTVSAVSSMSAGSTGLVGPTGSAGGAGLVGPAVAAVTTATATGAGAGPALREVA
jgi:2-oxo-4-hydroxy-4-carboxy-5-ureidoimidazoline decarboxylase